VVEKKKSKRIYSYHLICEMEQKTLRTGTNSKFKVASGLACGRSGG
jgi:hypothetical protein